MAIVRRSPAEEIMNNVLYIINPAGNGGAGMKAWEAFKSAWQLPVPGFVITLILTALEDEPGLIGGPIWLRCIGTGLVCSNGLAVFLLFVLWVVLLWNPHKTAHMLRRHTQQALNALQNIHNGRSQVITL